MLRNGSDDKKSTRTITIRTRKKDGDRVALQCTREVAFSLLGTERLGYITINENL
jgi:hypothetical protein